ncbi:hypothetical protein K402DRAFT_423609 [Aulographum hederae CBS 113979]|uniref:Uncharacterized protein n=1 Tax=Aulographum hederae CBS 113979 TaxID=1176131 RepID=A0A6G1GRW3_9PEZI|nr:hypothetical protein K402DRAFT_423609 [Aulographum hederae CBS 113979]
MDNNQRFYIERLASTQKQEARALRKRASELQEKAWALEKASGDLQALVRQHSQHSIRTNSTVRPETPYQSRPLRRLKYLIEDIREVMSKLLANDEFELYFGENGPLECLIKSETAMKDFSVFLDTIGKVENPTPYYSRCLLASRLNNALLERHAKQTSNSGRTTLDFVHQDITRAISYSIESRASTDDLVQGGVLKPLTLPPEFVKKTHAGVDLPTGLIMHQTRIVRRSMDAGKHFSLSSSEALSPPPNYRRIPPSAARTEDPFTSEPASSNPPSHAKSAGSRYGYSFPYHPSQRDSTATTHTTSSSIGFAGDTEPSPHTSPSASSTIQRASNPAFNFSSNLKSVASSTPKEDVRHSPKQSLRRKPNFDSVPMGQLLPRQMVVTQRFRRMVPRASEAELTGGPGPEVRASGRGEKKGNEKAEKVDKADKGKEREKTEDKTEKEKEKERKEDEREERDRAEFGLQSPGSCTWR